MLFLTVDEGVPQNVKCKKIKLLGLPMKSKKLIMFLFVIHMMYIKSLLKKLEHYAKKMYRLKINLSPNKSNKSEQNISMN